jgi:signal transduction histidine kinase
VVGIVPAARPDTGPSPATWHPQAVDAVLGVSLFAVRTVAAPAQIGGERRAGPFERWDLLACLVALVLITVRRRRPLPVFAVSAGFVVLSVATPWTFPLPAALACLICAYTMATRTARRTAWISAGVAGLVVGVAAGLGFSTWVVSLGLATALGDLVRTRRALLAEVLDRALRAEHSRDELARRRVIEERVRIARELHDVVAHNIAMISLQAGVAAHVLRGRPDQAEESLAHVRRAARSVLDELSTVLGVLRDPEHPAGPADEPAHGLAHLSELIDEVAGAGLRVEDRRAGRARPLPAAVDLAAYRIIQESLTNARKHAPDDRARLCLRFADDHLEIIVENTATGGPPGAGYGLIGMRERAAALGGRLSAADDGDGRFVVRAVLPAPAVPALEEA